MLFKINYACCKTSIPSYVNFQRAVKLVSNHDWSCSFSQRRVSLFYCTGCPFYSQDSVLHLNILVVSEFKPNKPRGCYL